MKKSIFIFAIAFLSTNINAQSPCDTLQQFVNYSTGTHTFCSQGTYNIGTPSYTSVVITPQNCNTLTCTFAVNGGAPTLTPALTFTPNAPGITTFTLTGNPNAYPACTQTITWSFTTIACAYTYTGSATAIQEYSTDTHITPIYYDMQGNAIEKRYNEPIFERIGTRVKLVRMEQP